MEIEHVVVIDRPLDEVWTAFDDPELLVEWQESMVACEQVSGEPGESGSVSLQTVKRSDRQTDLTVTLLSRRPPEFSKSQYEGLALPFTISNTFTAIDEETTEWHAVIDVRLNMVQRTLTPVLKGSLQDLAERNGEDFKRFVESRERIV